MFMRSARFSILAGTAVALVLTAATTVSVSPVAAQSNDGSMPSHRDVTASRPKPASQFGPSPTEGTRRATMPMPTGVQQQRREIAAPHLPAPSAAPAPAPILTNPEIKIAPIISGPDAPAPVVTAPAAPAPIVQTPVIEPRAPAVAAPAVQAPVVQTPVTREPAKAAATP